MSGANPRSTLLRVAWLSIVLGMAIEALLLAFRAGIVMSDGLGPIMADLANRVSWSFLVCMGLAIGTTYTAANPVISGIAGLISGSVALTVSRAVHKSVLQALTLGGGVALTGGTIIALTILKGVEYGFLGVAIGWVKQRPHIGIAGYLASGLAAGLVFGGTILYIIFRSSVAPLGASAVASGVINELLFPIGCSLVLYTAGSLMERMPRDPDV